MEDAGQVSALRAQTSPAVAALTAFRSRRFLSMPDLLRAGFKDSTPVTVSVGFHDAGFPKKPAKRAPSPAVATRSPGSSPALQPIQRFDATQSKHLSSAALDLRALLNDSAALLDSARVSAADEASLFAFVEAADFAGRVEEIARSVEYLQVVAAQAVERTRTAAQQSSAGTLSAATEWRTGWVEPVPVTEQRSEGAATSQSWTGTSSAHAGSTHAGSIETGAKTGSEAGVAGSAGVLDDGYRNAAEFLRARLRIGIGEARRRLALAPDVLPQPGMTGQDIPARRGILAEALATGDLPSRSATIISSALDKVRNLTDDATITRMEHALTKTAVESDPDFVTKMAKRWTDRIDQDGPEPTEEVLRQHQGAFLRRRRRYGLHHIEIFATTEQYETLTTTMNTATNPRLTTTGAGTAMAAGADPRVRAGTGAGAGLSADAGFGADAGPDAGDGPDLDRRSRAQKLLDGLTGACNLAMTTAKLPSNGGLRPQLTVTIDYNELFDQLTQHTSTGLGAGTGTSPDTGTGTATFAGPIHPNTIRKIACDADIIPVLLGSEGRILDIGRTTRIFPPHIRKAITARDGGCAFPDCTIPAPWCEAHHTTYWSHGGTTSTHNGTLLCSHHHHLIHKEQWRIDMKTGVPWFIPPPHIDPQQKPRRNHHHTPQRT
ncbi:HNH endonuclease signature motif containing protein [Arthrobacter sp. StoSoilB20]|uniref:HNH endonuclease signature motif containing protein n=1 Tax=Arthrobacter sp. StoSoilB20 TaxID=2830995 RepID=UPI001CC3DACB|nr:HNH endonuclease signature motif containing protein [Arthrobacter sp. StoSoilB20]